MSYRCHLSLWVPLSLSVALSPLSASLAQAQTPPTRATSTAPRPPVSPSTPAGTTTSTTTSATTTVSTVTTGTTTTNTATPSASSIASALGLGACVASGKGKDYPVGPGQTYANLDSVPWEALKAGDTVRIYYSSTPYKSKFMLAAQGTAAAPVRICGVKGPNGERPVIDGSGATTRTALAKLFSGTLAISQVHQDRSLIVIKPLATQGWTAYPSYIQIDGLKITRAHPSYSYRSAEGTTRPYAAFGACIWVDRGQNITIADNEITDCQMGVFSKSTDDGDFAVTKNLRIAGNRFAGHGIVGDWHEHSTYTQSVGTVIEYNDYGPLRSGSPGNSVKDRSVGTVVRFNRIEEGSHAVDLVESEDFPRTALALPAYRTTLVYGNQIVKTGDSGSVIHYGGDHFGSTPGASWGEPIFRKGVLYFYNNTVQLKGTQAWLFQISTTEERVEAFNNAVYYAPTVTQKNLRMNQEVVAPWIGGGQLALGRNWISAGWADSDAWHPVPGVVTGQSNLVTGTTAPFDLSSWVPLSGSKLIDGGQVLPSAVMAYPPVYQLDATRLPQVRPSRGVALDLGAVER